MIEIADLRKAADGLSVPTFPGLTAETDAARDGHNHQADNLARELTRSDGDVVALSRRLSGLWSQRARVIDAVHADVQAAQRLLFEAELEADTSVLKTADAWQRAREFATCAANENLSGSRPEPQPRRTKK